MFVATPNVLEAFERNQQFPGEFIARHLRGDWGDLDEEDRQANADAKIHGGRLLSAYHLKDGTKIWIIEDDHVTVLLPEDY